jgi:hypothetical protein
MPDWKYEVRERLPTSSLEGAAEAELIEELAQHAEQRCRDLQESGEDEEAAYQQVLGELGCIEQVPLTKPAVHASIDLGET